MTDVAIRELRKEYGTVAAVDGLDLDIADGEFVTLLGPSGCGKTTTLRCLAGLEEPSGGEIRLGGTVVAGNGTFVPPERRGTGMVFQSYALWPHMTVRGNVGYPLKLARMPRREVDERVRALLDRVGLGERADRMASALSGGQQQRVALARALANHPQLLLFDEPLSNLDAKLRESMRQEIRRLHDEIGTTSVYVTHDQEEAMVLSDRIAVMNEGRIQQLGTPRDLFTRPANAFVADFMGFENIVTGTVEDPGPDRFTVTVPPGPIAVAGPAPVRRGEQVRLAFRGAHVRVGTEALGDSPAVSGRVRTTSYVGSRTELDVDCRGLMLRAHVRDAALARLGTVPEPGDEVCLTVSPSHVVVLDA